VAVLRDSRVMVAVLRGSVGTSHMYIVAVLRDRL